MVLVVCSYCREGAGGECHTPGCAFWANRAPDVPLTAALSREEMVEATARAGARQFGYELVFDAVAVNVECYGPDYWRGHAAEALIAAGVIAAEPRP